MKTLRTMWALAAEMVATSPRGAVMCIVLTLAMTFTEGLGLLLLMPLLTLVGVEEPNTMPKVTGWLDGAFAAVHVTPTLGSVLILFVGIAGCRALLQRWQAALSTSLQASFVSSVRGRLYRAIAQAEWKFLVTRRVSEFVHVLGGEVGQLGTAAAQVLDLGVVAAVSLVYVGLAFHLSVAVATLVMVCAAALAWAVRGTLDRARATGARASRARSRLHTAFSEHMASMKTAKSYGAVDRHVAVFSTLSDELREVTIEEGTGASDLQQSLEFGSTALLAIIVFVSLEVLNVPAAPMLVLLFTFARLMPRLVTIYRRLQTVFAVLPVFDNIAQFERQCLDAAEAVPAGLEADLGLARAVRLERVSFSYPGRPEPPALADVSFEIAAGMTTAIVGPSGAGKSTVADLLIGLLPPTGGRIVVDGEALSVDRIAAWRRHISYVPQDTFLFHDTVRANLDWAAPRATDAELWWALRLAAADEFVASLPEGLDTVVGERGVLISGGERQRLSFARALLRQPQMLVLDEATSSLDSENELRIQQAIEGLHELMTIVIITHRLSTIRHADVIHVIDGGRLVQSGTWDQLWLDHQGRFRELCVAQGLDFEMDAGYVLRGT